MTSLLLRNFRGCERAELDLAPLALVAGQNGAGKSSIAQAVGAVASGLTIPIAGMRKTDAGMLVRTGAAQASIELRGESGTAHITWPAAELVTNSTPPKASRWAVGLDSVALLDVRERAQVLADYLKSEPTREDLATELRDLDLPAMLDEIWGLIKEQDWDKAHLLRKDEGAQLKGQWRGITRQNWGSRIAQNWKPQGWVPRLDRATEAELAAAVTRAKAAHEKAIAEAAISGAERQQLEDQVAQIEALKDALRDAEVEEARLETELDKAETTRAKLPPAGADHPCVRRALAGMDPRVQDGEPDHLQLRLRRGPDRVERAGHGQSARGDHPSRACGRGAQQGSSGTI